MRTRAACSAAGGVVASKFLQVTIDMLRWILVLLLLLAAFVVSWVNQHRDAMGFPLVVMPRTRAIVAVPIIINVIADKFCAHSHVALDIHVLESWAPFQCKRDRSLEKILL
jgi:hypothetical protein